MSGPTRLITNLGTPLDTEVRDLFRFTNPDKFANLSDEEIAEHITQVRDKACECPNGLGSREAI